MNWIEFKSLNKLYQNKEIKLGATVSQSGEFRYLINSLQVLSRSHDKLFALDGFGQIYENDYQKRYDRYEAFLSENDLLKPQTRFEESDIKILMDLKQGMDSKDLLPIRDLIIEKEETIRGVSLMFFRNEKYLIGKESLINAVKQFLNIDVLADDRDQQYKYVLECRDPKCIVLCENIDFLKRPSFPRANNIELWYAGGMNLSKLDFSDYRGLPIYYSGDWDYHGLCIIYRIVKEKIPAIKLLTPNGSPKSLVETEHKSFWKGWPNELESILQETQKELLKNLIENDQWIIEESNDLFEMTKFILDKV